MRGILAILFTIIGTIALVLAFTQKELKLLIFAGATLFYTKAYLSFILRSYQINPPGEDPSPRFNHWLLVAIGYLVSATSCLFSGISGEGIFGFIGAPVLLLTAIVFAFVAKKSNKKSRTI